MKTVALYAFLLLLVNRAASQSATNSVGARAMALGYASATLHDPWSIHNNVAGLAKVEQTSAAFTYEANPAFASFNRTAGVFATPIKKFGVGGVAIYRFGDDLYNEQLLSAGFANKMGIASLGIKLNYFQYHTEGFGNAQALTVSLGGIAELTPSLSVGAHIVNINQPRVSHRSNERMPTLLILGLGFKPSEKLFLTTQIEKDLDYSACWKTGAEYKVHKKIFARTGYNVSPQAAFAGVGFKPKKFQLDYAFQYQMNLGAIHQATVLYTFVALK